MRPYRLLPCLAAALAGCCGPAGNRGGWYYVIIRDATAQNIQVFIATHSLFLLRELEIALADYARRGRAAPARFFGLIATDKGVQLNQADTLADIGELTALEESLKQADRYMNLGE